MLISLQAAEQVLDHVGQPGLPSEEFIAKEQLKELTVANAGLLTALPITLIWKNATKIWEYKGKKNDFFLQNLSKLSFYFKV